MRTAIRLAILALAAAFVCEGQTGFYGGTAGRIRRGSSLPATCSPANGEVFYRTATAVGLYVCTATNVWTLGAVSHGATLPANCTMGDVFFDTDATAGQNV